MQPKINLYYMIDTTIRNTNRLTVLSFKNGDKEPARYSANYYVPLVEIKHVNPLFDNQPFSDQPINKRSV